jgi:hypothetical protein
MSTHWLAALALGALWVNASLIAADAWKRSRWIRRFRRYPRPSGAGRGTARVTWTEGQGPDRRVAEQVVQQRGRLMADERRVLWHDRRVESHIHGGRAEWSDGPVTLPPTDQGELWITPASPGPAAVDVARRSKGALRDLSSVVSAGEESWLSGTWTRSGDGWTVEPEAEGPVILSAEDPNRWASRSERILQSFAGAVMLAVAFVTVLCLWPPIYGTVSTAGAMMGLAFFLLVQPAGTWVRGRTVEPAYRDRGGPEPAATVSDVNPDSTPR